MNSSDIKMTAIRAATIRGLLSGLGVHDIAVSNGFDVEDVREEVSIARSEGRLATVVAMARSDAMKRRAIG